MSGWLSKEYRLARRKSENIRGAFNKLNLNLGIDSYDEVENRISITLINQDLTFDNLIKLSEIFETKKINVRSTIDGGYYPGEAESYVIIDIYDWPELRSLCSI